MWTVHDGKANIKIQTIKDWLESTNIYVSFLLCTSGIYQICPWVGDTVSITSSVPSAEYIAPVLFHVEQAALQGYSSPETDSWQLKNLDITENRMESGILTTIVCLGDSWRSSLFFKTPFSLNFLKYGRFEASHRMISICLRLHIFKIKSCSTELLRKYCPKWLYF